MSVYPPDIQKLIDQHERRVERAIFWIIALCVLAIIPSILSFVPAFKPQSEHTNVWFQRSGSLMTVIAAFAYANAANLLEMIRGGTFGETWNMYDKYATQQKIVSWISVVLVSVGTVIWGYGDLLVFCIPLGISGCVGAR